MTLLEMVENYGPIVFCDSETGVIIQRNGSYLCWVAQERDGSYFHSDVRSVEDDAYVCTLAKAMAMAMDSAEEWFKEVMGRLNEEEETDGIGG